MPPQIKADINRSGYESTDLPAVCESCLPENPYVQMTKENVGELCKLCTRPFTVFRWKPDRTSRQKRTNICLTCARLKNCCQCCMLDLSFGLPIVVRDAALKMVAPGPESAVNREYYAQENEKEIEEGRGGLEEYEKTDQKARELLRKLANSEPYYKKQRRLEAEAVEGDAAEDREGGPRRITAARGPIRTQDSRPSRGGPYSRGGAMRGGRGGGRGSFTKTATRPPGPEDILPPQDPHIMSLFVTGVEDDIPEYMIRKFFEPFGVLRSVICSHRAHCAFINFATREAAETAAAACQGKAVIMGCPLRIQWGKPKPLDSMEQDERMSLARQGRDTASAIAVAKGGRFLGEGGEGTGRGAEEVVAAVAPPPGQEDVHYASLKGD